MPWSSTPFLVSGADGATGGALQAASGERPLLDFPPGSTVVSRRVPAFGRARCGWSRSRASGRSFVDGSLQHFSPPTSSTLLHLREHRASRSLQRSASLTARAHADRKSATACSARMHLGIDHGRTFHVDPKLRTVSGTSAEPIPPACWRTSSACSPPRRGHCTSVAQP